MAGEGEPSHVAKQLVDELGKFRDELFFFFGGGFELRYFRLKLGHLVAKLLDGGFLLMDLFLLLDNDLVLLRNFCLYALNDFFGRKAHDDPFSLDFHFQLVWRRQCNQVYFAGIRVKKVFKAVTMVDGASVGERA